MTSGLVKPSDRRKSHAAVRPTMVLVASDNPVSRLGLRGLLANREHVSWKAAASRPNEALRAAAAVRPDVVIVDFRLPSPVWLALISELARVSNVLVLTHVAEPRIVSSAVNAGATSYLVHGEDEADDLIAAITRTGHGRAYLSATVATKQREPVAGGLSEREAEVMEHVALGESNAAIAKALFLSEKTVKNHLYNVFIKLRARNRTEAVALWHRHLESTLSRPLPTQGQGSGEKATRLGQVLNPPTNTAYTHPERSVPRPHLRLA
jgi:DNA-binding NarL/FixJ family response regulator